jgi:small-conductance mechanosensitive channel
MTAPSPALLILTALLAAALPAAAVNRCTDAQGKVTFSDQPCEPSSQGGAIAVKPATGDSPTRARAAVPPPPTPATVSGKRARLAAVNEAIANVTRRMETEHQDTARQVDKLYRELADASRVADMTPEAARASQAVTFNRIQGLQRAAGERLRDYQAQLDALRNEKSQLER